MTGRVSGRVSRRTALGAGVLGFVSVSGVASAVEAGALPGKLRLDHSLDQVGLGGCKVTLNVPTVRTSPVLTSSFASALRHRTVNVAISAPPGHSLTGLPIVLILHGLGGVATTGFGSLGMHLFLADYVKRGGKPFALVGMDGGSGYWHPRRWGDDALGMLGRELVPRLGGLGLDINRVGAYGWSMGGFGALLLARESGRASIGGLKLRAVAAASPALFASASAYVAGAFDSAADWSRWGDLAAKPAIAPGVTVLAECGEDDPFSTTTRSYLAHAGSRASGSISQGCHLRHIGTHGWPATWPSWAAMSNRSA